MARQRHTGSLRLRRKTWWARYYVNGERIEESMQTADRAEAGRRLRDKLKTVGTERYVSPSAERVTFGDLAAGIVHDYEVQKQNRSTKRLRQAIAHLEGAFAADKALAITAERVDAYVASRLAEGAGRATVNRELAALRRMFRLAIARRQLPSGSAPAVTLLREDNTREGFVEPADFDALLAALRAEDPDVADVAEFAYLTLARRENVLGAAWSWFTLAIEGGAITGGAVRLPGAVTKNGRPLTLPLSGRLLEVVRRRWALRVAASPFVFHRGGRKIVRFEGAWRTATAAVGLAGLVFHDLRRSGARNLRRAGISEEVIMRLGGWRTRAMFARYAIVDERDLEDAAAAYDRVMAEAARAPRKVARLPLPAA